MNVTPTVATRAPSLGTLFLAFGKIGLLSFGGGSTTLVLMEQEIVRRRQWMTSREFLFSMAMSRMWPGVHLIAQAVLIGHLLRGFVGGMVCMAGMMVPATAITIMFTAFWLVLRENPLGTGMIRGVLPATAGLSFAVAYRFAKAELEGETRTVGAIIIALAVGSFVLMALANVSSVLTVLGAGVLAIVLLRRVGGADGPA
jgi:chromate transporter